jgi:transcriptional regulator with XRE-family HTH domain
MRDIDSGRGVAAAVLRQAREQSGLTQKDLAALAGTTQSAIAAYEAGDREPTVPVLSRIIHASGGVLTLSLGSDTSHYRLADVARDISRSLPGDDTVALRYVFEFLRGLSDDGQPVSLLVATAPDPTGDERFDALLAAIAEDACVREGKTPPPWVFDLKRFLDRAWWVSPLPSAKVQALVHTPASFRRRGVMIDRRDLEAA